VPAHMLQTTRRVGFEHGGEHNAGNAEMVDDGSRISGISAAALSSMKWVLGEDTRGGCEMHTICTHPADSWYCYGRIGLTALLHLCEKLSGLSRLHLMYSHEQVVHATATARQQSEGADIRATHSSRTPYTRSTLKC
jgi:hypothetical protein